MSTHDHAAFVDGCYRCDLSRAEVRAESAPRLFPRGVGDPFCPNGGLITASYDHRLLWHLEAILAVDAPMGSRLAEKRRDLQRYLHARCQHHWHKHDYDGETLWQCLWCNDVDVHPGQPIGGQVCTPEGDIEAWPTAVVERAPHRPDSANPSSVEAQP